MSKVKSVFQTHGSMINFTTIIGLMTLFLAFFIWKIDSIKADAQIQATQGAHIQWNTEKITYVKGVAETNSANITLLQIEDANIKGQIKEKE